MAHIIPDEKAEKIEDILIFAILSPFDKSVFIWKCLQSSTRNTYKDHFTLRKSKTKTLFEKAKSEQKLPPMYPLEQLRTSQRKAFRHCIAWTKYFLDHGYQLIPDAGLVNEMTGETEEIYRLIKGQSLTELISPDKELFPNYGQKNQPSKEKNTPLSINVKLKKEEYLHLKKEAEKAKIPITTYVRQMALNGQIVRIDLKFLPDYLREFTETKNILKQILYTIYIRGGNYHSADLENIQNAINDITKLTAETTDQISAALESVNGQKTIQKTKTKKSSHKVKQKS